MTRKLCPFRRADGLHELVIIGKVGLEYAYSTAEKVTHFVEDTEGDYDSVNPDSYYIQLDENYTLPQYNKSGVHLLRNIEVGEEEATYEHFARHNDRDDRPDWVEEKCPASDFPYLQNRDQLVPMKLVEQ